MKIKLNKFFKKKKNKLTILLGLIFTLLTIIISVPLVLSKNSKENNQIELIKKMGIFSSNMNARYGNKYFLETENSLKEWGLSFDKVFQGNQNSISKVKIKYIDYDFNKNHVQAKLFWNENNIPKTKDIIVIGFKNPKKELNNIKIIQKNEFQNIIIPPNFVIPKSVLKIASSAFKNAKGTIPSIPDSVTKIEEFAFSNTTLSQGWVNPKAWNTEIPSSGYEGATFPNSFKIPAGVKKIGESAFKNAKGTIPSIPDSVTEIEESAFSNTTLPQGWVNPKAWNTEIPSSGYEGTILPNGFKIPDSVTKIEESAFSNTTLPQDWVNPKAWSKTIPSSGYQGTILPNGFKIPDSVTKVGFRAFESAKGTIPSIPDTVTEIGYSAFSNTTLPQGWVNPKAWNTEIPSSGYEGTTFPNNFKIPDSVTKIGFRAFNQATLSQDWVNPKAWNTEIPQIGYSGATFPNGFKIPDSVTKIYFLVFNNTTLSQGWVNPKAWNTEIPSSGYQGAIFPNSFKIPDSVQKIGYYAFEQATLSQDWVNPKAWNTEIPSSGYEGAILPNGFKIPDTVTKIGRSAFLNVKIPKGTKWSKRTPVAGSQIIDI